MRIEIISLKRAPRCGTRRNPSPPPPHQKSINCSNCKFVTTLKELSQKLTLNETFETQGLLPNHCQAVVLYLRWQQISECRMISESCLSVVVKWIEDVIICRSSRVFFLFRDSFLYRDTSCSLRTQTCFRRSFLSQRPPEIRLRSQATRPGTLCQCMSCNNGCDKFRARLRSIQYYLPFQSSKNCVLAIERLSMTFTLNGKRRSEIRVLPKM